MSENGEIVPGSVYLYAPNKGAPVFFALAFAVSGAFHLWQCIRLKSFKITALIPFTCVLFCAGFVLREVNAFNYGSFEIYIGSMTLIYMSPPLLELANYHILGRILYFVPYNSPIHPGRTLTTFGFLSGLVEALNGLGVAWVVNPTIPKDLAHTGDALLKASLILQIGVIVIFVFLTSLFQRRCHRMGLRHRSVDGPCITMYISSILILIRCIYRIVQHFAASSLRYASIDDLINSSPEVRYEWFFYVFEAVPMTVNVVLWNVRHPRYYLPENYNVYLAQDGHTELVGPGWTDDRAFLVTALDPFGLFTRGKGEKKPFWEENGYADQRP